MSKLRYTGSSGPSSSRIRSARGSSDLNQQSSAGTTVKPWALHQSNSSADQYVLQLASLPGFPLWEKDVHDVLAANLESLQSIFRAYAASSLGGSQNEMDMEEFHDFVIEADLITDQYGFDTMSGQFTKANAGSNDAVLEFHEFLTMLVRISFFRANPQYGMRKGKDQKNAEKFDDVPLPGCLSEMLTEKVLPNSRTDTYAEEFANNTLPLPEVQAALGGQLELLGDHLVDAQVRLVEEPVVDVGDRELLGGQRFAHHLGHADDRVLENEPPLHDREGAPVLDHLRRDVRLVAAGRRLDHELLGVAAVRVHVHAQEAPGVVV